MRRARRNLIGYTMVEQDDAIGNVFFQPVPGERAFTAFGGDHCGHASIFEPAKQTA